MSNIFCFNRNELLKGDEVTRDHYAQQCISIARFNPLDMYPYFDEWVNILNTQSNKLKCTAMEVLSWLSFNDPKNKTELAIPIMLKLVGNNPDMNCIMHVIAAISRISLAKPHLTDLLLNEIISMASDGRFTNLDKNKITESALIAMVPFIDRINDNKNWLTFIVNVLDSENKSNVKLANKILKKLDKMNQQEN